VRFCFFNCCAGWGDTEAFTKVLMIYQIYHNWIHLFHHSPLSPLPHSWNSFSKSQFSSFVPYSPSLSPLPPLPHWYQPPQVGPVPPSCSPILYEEKKKKKKKMTFCLFKIATQGISLCHSGLWKDSKAGIYHLSHASSPFALVIFELGSCLFFLFVCFPSGCPGPWSSCHTSCHIWLQAHTTMPSYLKILM
jgi:hypothetical protein